MCMTAYVDNEEVSTVGELQRLLNVRALVFAGSPCEDAEAEDSCLCYVNAIETAKAAGVSVFEDVVAGMFFLRDGQRYEFRCECGKRFDVRQRASHFSECPVYTRDAGVAYSGPYLVRAEGKDVKR